MTAVSPLIARFGVWIFAAAVLLVMPYVFTSSFALNLMSQMGVLIIFALAYNMLLGQGGMLSFGHAVYMGRHFARIDRFPSRISMGRRKRYTERASACS